MNQRERWFQELRHTAFGRSRPDAPRRVGAEVEIIAVDAVSRRSAPIVEEASADAPATLPLLRDLASRRWWAEEYSPKSGVPEFSLPGGGRLTFEPGGQIEYSAPPHASLGALVRDLRRVVSDLQAALEPAGLDVLTVGVDPLSRVEDVPLRLTGERYRRMDAHFASIGPHGARMMRQTASIQICLDAGDDPTGRWRLLNSLAPYVVAIFANSPMYEGVPTGHQSTRRSIWGALDPSRTGVLPGDADAAVAYGEFAMQARAFLLGAGPPARPFRQWLECDVGDTAWKDHLTTLFPEVRPRGYFECRSCDALPAAWYAAPLGFLAGLAYEPDAARGALEIAGPPDATLLERAGRCGMTDPAIAARARALAELSLHGLEALGGGFAEGEFVEECRAFFDRFTRRGIAPAAETLAASFA
jgi:glutamate--cysteine ligase